MNRNIEIKKKLEKEKNLKKKIKKKNEIIK